jgi:hypothetical protein
VHDIDRGTELRAHRNEGTKEFNGEFYIKKPAELLDEWEAQLYEDIYTEDMTNDL